MWQKKLGQHYLKMQGDFYFSFDQSSNPTHGEVCLIQHYVIEFVSDLRQVGGFLLVIRFPAPTDRHDITEILLKVALNGIIPALIHY